MTSHFGIAARLARFARSWLSKCLVGGLLAFSTPTTPATNSTHWSFLPLVRPPAPSTPRSNAVDSFVSHELAKSGRVLAANADRFTLLRRLSFDLRGLPPSPEELADF